MTNHYRKRRIKAGLTISDVAVGIDMDYMQYALIDRGLKKMPNKYLERFNTLLSRSKGEASIAKMSREDLVNEWWHEVSQQRGHGKYGLTDIMNTFNIATLGELDKLLGYRHPGASSHFLQHAEDVTYNIKNKYYSFFENELNIQPIKKSKVKPTVEINTKEQNEVFTWWNNFDFKKWYTDNNISRKHICDSARISTGTLSNLYNKKFEKPSMDVLYRVKDYVEHFENDKPVVMTFTSVPADEVPEEVRKMSQDLCREVNENMRLKEKLSEKYKMELEKLNAAIERHELIIADLRRDIEIYEKILKDINED